MNSGIVKVALILGLVLAGGLAGCSGAKEGDQNASRQQTSSDRDQKVSNPQVTGDQKAPNQQTNKDTNVSAQPNATGNVVVVMETSQGTIKIELDGAKAPISVKNFLQYVDSGFYNGTIFHRVIPTFMIQGGGFTPDMQQKETGAPIKNEAQNGLKNLRGTLAMARTGVVDSATAQFFINVTDNDFLNYQGPGPAFGYAVFGKVIDGMDVVDKIKSVKTGQAMGMGDVPKEPVIIVKAYRQ